MEYIVKCVNAHDLCHLGGPCPYCEPVNPLRERTGKFAKHPILDDPEWQNKAARILHEETSGQ